jgi:hypothetical protein
MAKVDGEHIRIVLCMWPRTMRKKGKDIGLLKVMVNRLKTLGFKSFVRRMLNTVW